MTEIDGIRTWSYVHKNKVIHKISDQYVKACRRKVRKTVTDGRTDGRRPGRTDGHHHTIIRPVWRRAYKKHLLFVCLSIMCIHHKIFCSWLTMSLLNFYTTASLLTIYLQGPHFGISIIWWRPTSDLRGPVFCCLSPWKAFVHIAEFLIIQNTHITYLTPWLEQMT